MVTTAFTNLTAPRVLHVIDSLGRCSVEAWLLQTLRIATAQGISLNWTFYCVSPVPGSREAEALALGAKIVRSPVELRHTTSFMRALRAELKNGKYQVLHAHHDLMSAVYLASATGLPLRKIVHVHNADETVPSPNAIKRGLLRPVLRRICLTVSDYIVANSEHSLEIFLKGRKPRLGRDFVQFLGIDPVPFRTVIDDKPFLRRKLSLPENAQILLFAGRMTPEKNPVLVVDIFAELRRKNPSAFCVFVGDGSLEAATKERARLLGIAQFVRFTGWRHDIPEIMAASDWFILPHPEYPPEGFGIAVVEAQLAGLRLLLSRGVRDAPLLPTAVFRRLPLAASPNAWAEAAMSLASESPSRSAALDALKNSPMNPEFALRELLDLHAKGFCSRGA